MKRIRALLVIGLNIFVSFSSAQNENKNFRALVAAGIVGSQVDGDSYGGYNKAGPMLGFGINRPFGESMELEFSFNYLQKGARKNANPTKGDYNFYLFRLHYLEIPVLLKYNYKKIKFEAGVSYAYLIKYSEENTAVGYYYNYPPKNSDWCYNVGLGYNLTSNLLANLRYSYSFIPIRDYNTTGVYLGTFWTKIFNRGLYNNLLTISLNYYLNPKKN